jgi:CDP-glycerol glycerophosphotransferase
MLFNSFGGRFSDSPRAIHEEIARRTGDVEHVWIAAPGSDAFPRDATTVAPFSLGYLREAGRAGVVVSNLQMPRNFVKRRGVTYVQTWHGTPLKRIGFDNERWKRNPGGLDRMAREFATWDFLVSQNRFSSEIFRRAFRYDGEILETGYPRNDALRAPDAEATRERVRAALGIEAEQRAILYAPTWRDNLVDEGGSLRFSLALDADHMARRLGGDHVLLLRLHYLLTARLADDLGAFGRNVSEHPDIRELYLAADAMITDYSSAMFDFAVTGKPIVFFTYDLDEYRDGVRGFYFDLEAEAPGPLCRTTDEVVAALEDLDAVHAAHGERYARFRERFCPFDDGGAAARVVDRALPFLPAARR